MAVFGTGLLVSEDSYPAFGRIVAAVRDLEPVNGAYELFCEDTGAAVVFVVYHQGEPMDLSGYEVLALVEGDEQSPYQLEQAPSAAPSADAAKGEVRWAVPEGFLSQPGMKRVQIVLRKAGEVDRASNPIAFRIRKRLG